MGAALREAWLWLLLAFILGLVTGYFVKTRTGRDGTTANRTIAADPASDARTAQIEALPEERRAETPAPATANAPLVNSTVNATVKGPVKAPAKATTKATTKATANASAATRGTTKTARRKPAVRAAILDLVAATTELGTTVKLDDLKLIEGIGSRIEALFKADGVTTWRELSKANVERLQGVLDAAGPRYKMHNPASWPKQAGLLADGKWTEFNTLTDKLKDGR